MLANFPEVSAQSGTLSSDVHLPGASLYALLDFIAETMPRWRDDPDRPDNTSETALTENLCDYLSSAARMSSWDFLQFRTEVVDEQRKGRKIDLAPKPCNTVIWIDGRRYTQYQSLLPIECKRLPTPQDKDRDEREYVINRNASTGGIQRFKAGNHGAAHTLGAMIAYVQEGTMISWDARVAAWIQELVQSGQPGWTAKDLLQLKQDNQAQGMAVLSSLHTRDNSLPDIELHHLWLKMN